MFPYDSSFFYWFLKGGGKGIKEKSKKKQRGGRKGKIEKNKNGEGKKGKIKNKKELLRTKKKKRTKA